MSRPVFRFAPSPNGLLHLGHAYSALTNLALARSAGGLMLLRIEDIDRARCSLELEAAMLDDLEWLGFEWDGTPRRQSEHFDDYRERLAALDARGLLYPAMLSRAEIRRLVAQKREAGVDWPNDPDGAPHYPGNERLLEPAGRQAILRGGADFAFRLDMARAVRGLGKGLAWREAPQGDFGACADIAADPAAWGDAVLARKDAPASYHLACVVDDALQGVTHVVRGRDLYASTALHRLLQELLGLPAPVYFHHPLVLDATGRKLSKSAGSTAIRHLRRQGASVAQIREMAGL
jgi:glutamyl-Q tRNA(Asp) synthetase